MRHGKLWATFALAALPLGAGAAELNTLSGLQVVSTPAGAQVVLAGSKAPTFTVFRLPDPDRLVVDLSSADATAIKGHHDGTGPVTGVVASQFSDERASVARVLVALDQASQYDVRADGKRVVISVEGGQAKAAEAPKAEAAAPAQPVQLVQAEAPKAEVAAPAEPKPAQVEAPAQLAAPAAQAEAPKAEAPEAEAAAPARDENVVASSSDEREVKSPAHRITGIAVARGGLYVHADGDIAKYELIELSDPPRLALDVYGVALSAKAPRSRIPAIKDVRVGAHGDKVRLVLDVAGQVPKYGVSYKDHGLVLALGPAARPAPAVADGEIEIDGKRIALSEVAPIPVRPEPAQAPAVATAAPEPSRKLADVLDVAFEDAPAGGRVDVKLSSATPYAVEHPDGQSAVLTLDGARLPKKLERSLDTSALETPVKMVSAFAVPGGAGKVRIVVSADGALNEAVVKTSKGLSWRLSVEKGRAEQVAVAPKAAGFTAEATSYAEHGAPQRTRYTGKKVSFEFKDIDIHNLLRVIAEISKKNIVVSDDVSGKVTIRLRNVPWDQALELILRSKGLGKEELGNIIRVAPLKQLEEEAKARAARKEALEKQADLVIQLIAVNYARAADMASRLKDVLTARGSVTVDERTNVLIVKDVQTNINRARALVQNLDTQTPQVLIESRIVEANTNFTREVGIQWGALAQASPVTGNPTGLLFPNVVRVAGGTQQTNTQGVADMPNWAVNLPAAVGQGSGGAVGFHFGSAGGALQLNLRLSALENEGQVKTISAPKVTTLDNNTARISQGISIPFTATSANGINVVFMEARLALEVTPHITQDGSILMSIKAENNQPDPSLTGANGQPSIQRKEANTQVLVKDGDTTVIGGIYVRRDATQAASVPLLGRIPLLGFLFRTDSEVDQRQELLIFITPRIINRTTIAQTL